MPSIGKFIETESMYVGARDRERGKQGATVHRYEVSFLSNGKDSIWNYPVLMVAHPVNLLHTLLKGEFYGM